MLNEGIVVNDTIALLKSSVTDHIRRIGTTTPEQLERAVFHAMVGHNREDVDWSVEDNQAGYYSWIRSFDQCVIELIEDGVILQNEDGTLVPTEAEPSSDPSFLVYPPERHAAGTG